MLVSKKVNKEEMRINSREHLILDSSKIFVIFFIKVKIEMKVLRIAKSTYTFYAINFIYKF